MCGIAGFLGLNNDALLWEMTRIISHRGPDDEGVFTDTNVGLGHRRLSIIDLSDNGHQPMADSSKRAVISYNGEIYNFKEIKQELIQLGYSFFSKTDTEVVLNAYLAWGVGCLDRFNGMFAFAIWDRRKKELFLARDRLGIKPLFYTQRNRAFVFGSEIKSILCWDGIKPEVNPRALDYYFTFRYNHLNESLFKGINKVPAGHYLIASMEDDGRVRFQKEKYWDVSFNQFDADKDELVEELSKRIVNSVDYRMISDVPLGAFLSSGVDSSTLVGIMKNHFKKSTHTFTVGFGYPGFEDELEPVRYTTENLKTIHREYVCQPDVATLIPKIIWHTDELNADPALIPTYIISEIAGRSVKVVLSGEGSDELFGGYERTLFMLYAWKLNRLSPGLMKLIPGTIGLIPPYFLNKAFKYSSALGSGGLERLSRFCRNIQDIGSSYIDVACVFNQSEKQRLYGPALKEQLENEDIAETINREFFKSKATNSQDLFNQLSYFELKTRLPNDLLAKVDSMTMAHSIEGRVPYLDHSFVEFASGISHKMKLRRLKEKYILRKASRRFIPPSIAGRKKDHFFVPIHLWLQNELKPVTEKILTRENLEKTGFLNPDFILYAYHNYQKGALYFARQIWNVLFFLLWHKMFIETELFRSMQKQHLSLEDLIQSA